MFNDAVGRGPRSFSRELPGSAGCHITLTAACIANSIQGSKKLLVAIGSHVVCRSVRMATGGGVISALAQGFLDGGAEFAVHYPGWHSHEIYDELVMGSLKRKALLVKMGMALNEKVAYQLAFGASLSGSRSVVIMKNYGFWDLESLVTHIYFLVGPSRATKTFPTSP